MVLQRKDKSTYSVIGAMAGSSMDGLDLAHVVFHKKEKAWSYELGKCETIPYPENLYGRLKHAAQGSRTVQNKLDSDFGIWIAETIGEFREELPEIDLLGVHGHTIIHKPEEGISWQLGKGEEICNTVLIPTISDFRTEDVLLGGQGAPLVPKGDFELFHTFDACLNLGGIANISIKQSQTAWDICPCNQVLNYFSSLMGQEYDREGAWARDGKFNASFYNRVNALEYLQLPPPKSLPNDFIGTELLQNIIPSDGLHTYCQIIAEQVHQSLPPSSGGKLLITGGGAFNTYLMELIEAKASEWEVTVPSPDLISFKEAIVFAFLALLIFRNEINVLASVTGASKDSCSGVIHLP